MSSTGMWLANFEEEGNWARGPETAEGPRLGSSGAHWVAGSWGPAVPTARGSWRRDWRRVGKAEVDVEVDADMVEEKLEEEEEEEAEEEEEKDEENSSDKI